MRCTDGIIYGSIRPPIRKADNAIRSCGVPLIAALENECHAHRAGSQHDGRDGDRRFFTSMTGAVP